MEFWMLVAVHMKIAATCGGWPDRACVTYEGHSHTGYPSFDACEADRIRGRSEYYGIVLSFDSGFAKCVRATYYPHFSKGIQ